jgi:hypothetical protein
VLRKQHWSDSDTQQNVLLKMTPMKALHAVHVSDKNYSLSVASRHFLEHAAVTDIRAPPAVVTKLVCGNLCTNEMFRPMKANVAQRRIFTTLHQKNPTWSRIKWNQISSWS